MRRAPAPPDRTWKEARAALGHSAGETLTGSCKTQCPVKIRYQNAGLTRDNQPTFAARRTSAARVRRSDDRRRSGQRRSYRAAAARCGIARWRMDSAGRNGIPAADRPGSADRPSPDSACFNSSRSGPGGVAAAIKGPGIGMARRDEDIRRGRLFDDLAEIHHRDLVAELLDHAEVVGDENIGQAALALQALEQIENLRLDRNIKRGYRLVADDQVGLRRERARDARAAARWPPENWCGTGRPPAAEARPAAAAAHALVDDLAWSRSEEIERLATCSPARRARIERGERILKHDLQMPAHFAQRLAGQSRDVPVGGKRSARRSPGPAA